MSFADSLFRNSFWSYESHEIVLHRLSEIHTLPDEPPSVIPLERQSRFSISSEEDQQASSGSSNAIGSPLRMALHDKALPPIPRAYSSAWRRRRHASVRSSGLHAIDEISWPMPPGWKPPPLPPKDTTYLAGKMSRVRECLFVTTICMAQLCAQADIGQTLAILREIGASFGIKNTNDLIWVLAGYSLAVGTFILIAGRLGDTYGYKRIFLIGFVWSAIWSAISGTAIYSTHVLFIVSRVFQGLGAALSLPNGLALLGVTYPPGRQKAMAFTFVATMAPMGIIFGAASSSLLTLAWWPLTYIPESSQKNEMPSNLRATMSELDIPGAITGVSALVLISFVWNQAPLVGWQEPYLWIALIFGSMLALVFVLIESYYAPKPLIPFYALSSDISFVLVAGACGWSCFGIWVSYTWQFVVGVRGISPLLATAYISPCVVVGCLATLSAGLVLHRLGPFLVVCISLLGFTMGSALVATMPAVQIYWTQLFFSVLIVSWAMDTGFPAAALALSNAVEMKHQGTAASLVSTVMNYSISIGLGVARTVESYVNMGKPSLKHKLDGYRAALYTAVGLAGLGSLICFTLLLKMVWKRRRRYRNGAVVEGHKI